MAKAVVGGMIGIEALRSSGDQRVDTCDVDDARMAIGQIFCPHFLMVTGKAEQSFHARHRLVKETGYSINLVTYGAQVEIDPGELSRFFLLQIPIKGESLVKCGSSQTLAVAGKSATLLSPTLQTRMLWKEGCEKLILLMERTPVEDYLAKLIDGEPGHIEFDPSIDLTSPIGQGILRHADLMLCSSLAGDMPPAYKTMLRDGLTSLLLSGLRHNHQQTLARPTQDSGPHAVRKADEFIRANAACAIATADIAEAAGVPLRTLQDSYRKARGRTLIEAVQSVRLETLRKMLLAGRDELTVADAVFACGLGHLGRAAFAYRERFGESPSETLRRARN
ncbi:putative transcriptional regulatory protein [Rhizobium freirei PRF 81]|uniref:Putative transcriptional regulatory protein n=1 Tax=Rhizobium freirei PRF 81 TaxID=363754 RepID=N6U638_9HYPH|nr:AraC family transcriptional regulator [Rhizobium freirei]ENN85763.1 putative transcriptional regulatory protein [Rhizobium freirei PRF 81]